MQALAGVTAHIEVPGPGRAHRKGQTESPALPIRVEPGLVGLRLDRAEAHHAPKILRAIHEAPTLSELSAKPVPIMESRVTRSASASSLQPSVPSGRIGTTK